VRGRASTARECPVDRVAVARRFVREDGDDCFLGMGDSRVSTY
jgi:hypothetical protein